MGGPPKPYRVFVYSHPRTRSNLLFQILESHPSIAQKKYPFLDAFTYGPEMQRTRNYYEAAVAIAKEDNRNEYTYQAGVDTLQTLAAETEQRGKTPVFKEHVYQFMASATINHYLTSPRAARPTPVIVDHKLDCPASDRTAETVPALPIPNPTLLPDRFFTTFAPVIIIRHPALVIPSFLRAASSFGASAFDPDFPMNASYKWQRLVFECYTALYQRSEQQGESVESHSDSNASKTTQKWPIVMDGDKLVSGTQDQIEKLLRLLDLDPAPVKYTWVAKGKELSEVDKAFVGVINDSTGIIKSDNNSGTIELDREVEKWKQEWDDLVADKLKSFVEVALPDYEFLQQHCI